MDKDIERIIEGMIYWGKVYRRSRELFQGTGDEKYAITMEESRMALQAKNRYLADLYQRVTGKDITQIGNLPDVERMAAKNIIPGMYEFVESPDEENKG